MLQQHRHLQHFLLHFVIIYELQVGRLSVGKYQKNGLIQQNNLSASSQLTFEENKRRVNRKAISQYYWASAFNFYWKWDSV